MKELQEKTAILEMSNANVATKSVSVVKAAEKRKNIQVIMSEANALKRKSEELAGGNQCFAKCSFTTSGKALQALKKLVDFIR